VKQDSLPDFERSNRVANASNETCAFEPNQVFVLRNDAHCDSDVLFNRKSSSLSQKEEQDDREEFIL
jgi:hypothetical protein